MKTLLLSIIISACLGIGPAWARDMVNINTASVAELQKLHGISATSAAIIVDFRSEQGPYKNVDELAEVNGIGRKTLENIRNKVIFGEVEQ